VQVVSIGYMSSRKVLSFPTFKKFLSFPTYIMLGPETLQVLLLVTCNFKPWQRLTVSSSWFAQLNG